MSDWCQQPVNRTASYAVNSAGVNSTLWVNGAEVEEDYSLGFAYAIKSASTAVLGMLKGRCVAQGGRRAATDCVFTVGGGRR